MGPAVATAIAVSVGAGCAVRLGPDNNDPGPGGSGGNGNGSGSGATAGACSRVGSDVRLPTGAGTDTFAFLWAGDHYLLAYNDRTTGNGDIYTMQLNPDGSPRGRATVVDATAAASDLPSLVKTDNGYLVAWQEGSAGKAVRVRPLDAEGLPVGEPFTVAATSSLEVRPVLSRAPGGYAITWMDNPSGAPMVQLAFLDGGQSLRGPKLVSPTASGAGWPWLAGDDHSLAILWSDRQASKFDMHFASVDPGTLDTVNEINIRDEAPRDALLGRLVRTETGYIAAWEDLRGDDNQIFMAMLADDGRTIATGVVHEPETGDANWPNIAWTGATAAIVYYQWRDANPQIFLSLYDGAGQRVGGPHDFQVSSTPRGSMARFPDIQWTGSDFGVVWVDTRDGGPQLYFARVSCKL